MKKSILIAALGLFSLSTMAQDAKPEEGFVFTTVKENPITSIKNQNRSSTCWSFSTLGFVESELLRLGKGEYDLAEMFVVHKTMQDRGANYVRYHGDSSFSPGGSFYDVMYCIKNYGIVPMDVYKGLNYGEANHAFGEIDDVLAGYVNAVIKNSNKKLSTAWKKGFDGILDAYLGEEPEKFEYKGKEYTPRTFADEVVGLNMDDYVSLTSFTHHPFYSQFAIEVPDNWLWGMSYNLPIDELAQVMSNAIDNGYTFAWASDVSERGFQTSRPGVAVVPTTDTKEMSGAEIAKWEAMPKGNQTPDAFKQGPAPEKEITQEMRQQEFDNYLTTDDHGMHVIGKAKDQNGTVYYIVKNSWNQYNKFGGYFYASEPFMKYKTMNIIVHKNAIPKDIRKKLGIK